MDPVKVETQDVSVVNVPLPSTSHFPSLYQTPFHSNGFARGPSAAAASQPSSNASQSKAPSGGSKTVRDPEEKFEDFESRQGIFGYITLSPGLVLPYIFRKGVKYCSVRMAERKILSKYLTVLPLEVHSCYSIKSYYAHEAEYRLFNDINVKHNDCYFGKEAFSSKDLVVKLEDVIQLHSFLELCHKKLVITRSESDDRCGFLRINTESVVPYTFDKNIKQVPLFYFEGETDSLKLNSSTCSSWDLAYLKFCCKVQGIRNELFSGESCKVVALEEIKQHFPSGTLFEDYWPLKGSIGPVMQRALPSGCWVQKPPPIVQPGAAPNHHQSQFEYHMLNSRPSNQNPPRPSAPTVQAKSKYHEGVRQMTAAHFHQLAQQQQQQHHQRQQQQHQQQQQQQQLQQQQQQQWQFQQSMFQPTAQARQHAQLNLPKSRSAYNLTQIKEFPYDRTLSDPPYKEHWFLLENILVTGYNVRPHDKRELFVPLPELVRQLFPSVSLEAMHTVLSHLGISQYRGNSDQVATLRIDPKYAGMDTVPLILVKDLVSNLPTIKQYLASSRAIQQVQAIHQMPILAEAASKRPRYHA